MNEKYDNLGSVKMPEIAGQLLEKNRVSGSSNINFYASLYYN